MNKFVLKYNGFFLIILSFFSFLNIIYSYYFDITLSVNTYTITFFITLLIGFILIFFKKFDFSELKVFDKILVVLSGYLFLPFFIAIPYYLSIHNISILNCYFEAISGFTSTGFTIIENIKQIDPSLVIWRSTSQWIGGLYFLFSILLLIDIFDENLKKSLTNFLSLNSKEVIRQAFKIIVIYISLTIIIFFILSIINIRTFDSFNLSMTLISSGGFMPANSIDAILENDIQKVTISILMLVSFFSLFFIYNLITFNKNNLNYLSEDFNLLIYILVLISLFFVLFNNEQNFSNILLSISSSVSNIGISSNNISSNLSFLFLILVIIGGSFFSTSSGLRFVKVLSLIRYSLNNLLSHANPNQVYLNKISLLNTNTNITDINKYFLAILIFILSLFTITFLLTISGIEFENSFRIGILTIMNTVNSEMYQLPNFDFFNLNGFSKIFLILFMIIGRLELLSILILFKKFLFKN
tara:strand:- start:438 stop:1847 length:1410 start_codon:yes stop_codon:yes gene_type:complete